MLASNIRTAATRYGELSYYVDDLLIGGSLALYGEYSELEVEFLRQIVKPGWTVVDAGANIGCLTVPFAEMVGEDGKVVAFEPQPETFELLKKNCRLPNMELNNWALGSKTGSVIVPPLAAILHKNYGGVDLRVVPEFGDKVAKTTLDEFFSTRPVSLIKLDVEGMETAVLAGAFNLIDRCRPIIYAENDHADGLVAALQGLGYKVFNHKPPAYNPKNFNNQPANDLFNYVSINVLAIPNEQVGAYAHIVEQLRETSAPRPKRSVSASAWACVARCGGVGDNLLAASALRPLKEMGYMVEVITQDPVGPAIFDNNPYIDKLSVYKAEDWPKDPFEWNKWFAIRGYREYSRFAHLAHSVEVRHAPFQNMTSFWWPEKYRRKVFAGSYLETVHDLLDVPYTFGRLFWPTDEELEQAADTKFKVGHGPIIGWCCCGTRIDKVYPQAPMAIGRLIKELDAQVVLIGQGRPSKDFDLAEQSVKMVESQNGSTVGLHHISLPDGSSWPLRRALTFAQSLDLMIGPDTGPMWAVALEPSPKIMLHSHASVENITKHWLNTVSLHADEKRVSCWPCHRLHETIDTCRPNQWNNGAACISDISVDRIVETARKLLNKGDDDAGD